MDEYVQYVVFYFVLSVVASEGPLAVASIKLLSPPSWWRHRPLGLPLTLAAAEPS